MLTFLTQLQQTTQHHSLTNTHDKRNATILEINSVFYGILYLKYTIGQLT